MKIAMIGSGAAGSVIASYLRLGRADITLVDPYRQHMDEIAANGMDFTIAPDQHFTVTGFRTAYTAEGLEVMDLIIFLTKSTQLRAALAGIEGCRDENTVCLSLINGLGNEDILAEAIPENRILYGSGMLGTLLTAPGHCVSSPAGDGLQVHYGPMQHDARIDQVGKDLEACFEAGGCKAKYWDDVAFRMWKKAIINCTFNSLSALTRLKVRDMESDPNGWQLVEQVTRECCAVAAAKGVTVNADDLLNDYRLAMQSPISNYFPSMAQDMLIHKRQTEITTLNGAISAYGKKFGIPTPANDLITLFVCCMQANYDKQYTEKS